MRRLIFVWLAILLTACGLVGRSGKPLGDDATPALVKKALGAFYPIEGTHYQMAAINADSSSGRSDGSYDLSQLFVNRRYDYGAYNYVFLDVDAENVHALLPDNSKMILSVQGYPTASSAVDAPKMTLAWWFYTVVKEDSDQDGQLTYADLKTLSISDVGGNGYTELVSNVQQVLATVYKDGDKLLLIYRSKDKNFMSSIDLAARKVTRTTELPSFGEDVK